MTGPRVTVLGSPALREPTSPHLEGSYGRALRQLGFDVDFFDLDAAVTRHTRLGSLGRAFNAFVPVEAWVRKANRELLVHASQRRPALLLVSGGMPIRAGGLAQIQVASPETRLVLLWPDSLVNLERHVLEALPVFDLVCSYSRALTPQLERLGARRVLWLPFATDLDLYPPHVEVTAEDRARYSCDVLFVGNHRPEREEAVLALRDAGISVKVYGTTAWRRDAARRRRVAEYWQGAPLLGESWVRAARCAATSLNLIDPGNHPGANMRFFENLAAEAPTLSSTCPEMADEFKDGESVLYFDGPDSLVSRTRQLLQDAPLRRRIAERGASLVRTRHTYRHRAAEMTRALGLPTEAP